MTMTEAAPTTAPTSSLGWTARLVVEGLRTTDHRRIAPGALTWRDLPLPLMYQPATDVGHDGSVPVGRIDSIERVGDEIIGTGIWLNTPAGQEAASSAGDQVMRFVSIDLEALETKYVEISGSTEGDMLAELFDDTPVESDWYEEITLGRIMGASQVAFPAFPQACIVPMGQELPVVPPMGTADVVTPGLMASMIEAPVQPPARWFENPQLEEATPLTVTDDGQVFGHLALWTTCHTGIDNVCTNAPKSQKAYAYFQTGKVKTADGSDVSVGQLTMNIPHASASASYQAAVAHYDNTEAVVADVAMGEDNLGIWFAGAMRPGLSDEKIRSFRAASLSGDWRKIGSNLELVAALAVNVPGFPIVAAGTKNHEQVSLVAAAVPKRDKFRELSLKVNRIEKTLSTLNPLVIEQVKKMISDTSQTSH